MHVESRIETVETGLKVDARDESCVCDESRTWSR
jgi:hypothetical protein